jgi:P27 family predicted phage terminase small subunit
MPGPRPTPTYLRLLRGNPGKQAIRPEPKPMQSPETPEPPPFIVGYAADEWWRTGPELHRLGLLTPIDLMAFAAYCDAYSRWRTAEELLSKMAERDPVTGALLIKSADGNPRQNPLVRVARDAALDMLRYASEFGLTPAARAHLSSGVYVGGPGRFDGLLA